MAWALQLALAISTGTWALISSTTQLQVKGMKPAGGALANLAKLSVAALVQRWLIMVSLKLWAMAVGARPMTVNPMAPKFMAPKAMAVPALRAPRVSRSGKPDGSGLGMAPLGEGTGLACSIFPHVLMACPPSKPRIPSSSSEVFATSDWVNRRTLMLGWQLWAAGAAVLAALTAVLAKIGVGGIDSNLATLLRTVVVVVALTGLLAMNGQLRWQQLLVLPRSSLAALALSGLATGASWLCYFKALQVGPVARVAAIDKLSVLMAAGSLLVALP